MLTLYTKNDCPYSPVVLRRLAEENIPFEEKNYSANPAFKDELVALGGKEQVPFLIDHERGVQIYDSKEILEYLDEYYPQAERVSAPADPDPTNAST